MAESLLVLLMATLALGALSSERALGLASARSDACGAAHRFSLSSEPAGLELQPAQRRLKPMMQLKIPWRPHGIRSQTLTCMCHAHQASAIALLG